MREDGCGWSNFFLGEGHVAAWVFEEIYRRYCDGSSQIMEKGHFGWYVESII